MTIREKKLLEYLMANTQVVNENEKNKANIDYISMMTDVPLNNESEVNENE